MKYMKSGSLFGRIFGPLFILMMVAAWGMVSTGTASAQSLSTLVDFNGTNGSIPVAGLVADSNGNLFGTTLLGGTLPEGLTGDALGTVFEIPKTQTGYGAPQILVTFSGDNGSAPYGGLFIDSSGNLFGTTNSGGKLPDGSVGNGTVFEIPHTSQGYGALQTLVTFDVSNGSPRGRLTADSDGTLIGTTTGELEKASDWSECGPESYPHCEAVSYYGTVFAIPKDSSTDTGYATSPTALATFNWDNWSNGAFPVAGILIYNGNLFGTTAGGGEFESWSAVGYGTVFEIPKDSNSSTGYGTLQTLVKFGEVNGGPYGGLIADVNGNLFGTTSWGGNLPEGSTGSGRGTVFEIVNTATADAPHYSSTPVILATFDISNGAAPMGDLLIDANGNLFGTTNFGGSEYDSANQENGYGTVFQIVNNGTINAPDYSSTPTTLVSFNGSNGAYPMSGLIADAGGNLFGTTSGLITYALDFEFFNNGTVFQLTGSGFVPPLKFEGTPGKANCSGVTVSTLANTYGGIAHAAASLGYGNVAALQTAINSYCSQ